MSKILSREFIVLVTLVMLVSSSFIVHTPQSNSSGRVTRTLSGRKNTLANSAESISNTSNFYLTTNLSVPRNTTYVMNNENIILQSLSLTSLRINVEGKLEILNSSFYLSTAAYSTVKNFSLITTDGSNLDLVNSKITAPGSLVFNGSSVIMENSSVNSSSSLPDLPSENSLTMKISNSTLSIVNSTVAGLYEQKSSLEYRDASLYLYETPYSQNNAIPLKSSSYERNSSYINRVDVNVSYYGNANETADSLMVYYNNTYLENLSLPYSTNQSSRTETFSINFTGSLHNLSWMENSSNFRLVGNISFSAAIAISNLTVGMMSNDTVDLYGEQYYSYSVSNSTLFVFNSSLGLNQFQYYSNQGIPNYRKLSLSATNSSILLGDTALENPGSFSSPFFTLNESTVYFFRELSVHPSYHGIPYSNLNFTVQQTSTTHSGISTQSEASFIGGLNSTGNLWTSSSLSRPVLYETTQNGKNWNFTSQFVIDASPGNLDFTAQPYPQLTRSCILENYTMPIAYASFNAPGSISNYNGTAFVNYAGNLSALKKLDFNWTLYRNNLFMESGNYTVMNPGLHDYVDFPLNSITNISYGSYRLSIQFQTSTLHVFSGSGIVNTTFVIQAPVVRSTEYSINEVGLPHGQVWGITINNTDYFSNNSTLILNLTGNQNGTLISPADFDPVNQNIELNGSSQNYTVNFLRIYHRLTFSNNLKSTGETWEVIVNGKEYTTNNTKFVISLVPGTYNYEVIDPHGFKTTNSSGIVNLTYVSQNVTIHSQKEVSWTDELVSRAVTPHYYIPLAFTALVIIALGVRKTYHSWYVCEKCGATRKKKRDSCPYCGKKPESSS